MDNNILNKRQQALVTISCMEAKGDVDNLPQAITQALDDGVAVNDIKEAFSQLYAYAGFPRSLNAMGVLQKVLQERQVQGIKDHQGAEADSYPEHYNALEQGTKTQTRLSGRPFDFAFCPAIDYYLKAHLFGDIFARNNITHADRELITVSALCGLKGVAPQLKAHVRGARNMGLSDDAIHAIPQVLQERVGETEAFRARQTISEVYGEDFAEGMPVDFSIWPKGEPNKAYAQYFTGNSYLAPVGNKESGMVNVTFEPRCRNNWHIHHKAVQVLVCVAGRGWYQEWGKDPVEMTPGTVIAIPAEAKHWHGAAKDSWFQHLTYHTHAEEGASNEWLEPVSDEIYNKLK